MVRKYSYIGSLVFFISVTFPLFGIGQTMQTLSKHLKFSIEEINRFVDSARYSSEIIDSVTGKTRYYHPEGNYEDSLENESLELSNYLKTNLPQIQESLIDTVDIPRIHIASYRDGKVYSIPQMGIASSHDKKIRIWTWDTWTGGSMPFYCNVVEYSTRKGIKVVDLEHDLGWGPKDRGANNWFDTIYTTIGKDNIVYYLARATWRADGRTSGRGVYAFTIDDTVLNTCPRIFKDKNIDSFSGEDSIRCDIDASEYDCPPPLIKMNSNGSKLYIQHIAYKKNKQGYEKGYLTSKWEVYDFNGKYFEYKGIKRK